VPRGHTRWRRYIKRVGASIVLSCQLDDAITGYGKGKSGVRACRLYNVSVIRAP
jgi:hypothetical protein